MFLSKIWFILIALVSAVAVTFALVAPSPAVRKLEALEGQRLDRAQYAAEEMFKVDAHKWIDRVSKLGRDAIISESLDAASRGSGEYTVIHRTIQDRFRTLIPDLASGGIEEIVALDNKGRVIARVGGDNEKEYGDYIAGAEVVADALRGYLSDDVWGVGGKLERVAGAPVLSKAKDRIVGALYVGAETGPAFVERLKKNLDVDVALLLRGKVIASTREASQVDGLPTLIAQHTKDIETLTRTRALPLVAGADKLLVVAAPFAGQAGEQQAYYALIGEQPAKSDLKALLTNVSTDDLKWDRFPWVPLGLVTFAMIAVGLVLQRVEVESPLITLESDKATMDVPSPVAGTLTELRVLLRTVTSKDAALALRILNGAGIECHSCATGQQMIAEIENGAGALLIAEETLTEPAMRQLAALLQTQAILGHNLFGRPVPTSSRCRRARRSSCWPTGCGTAAGG